MPSERGLAFNLPWMPGGPFENNEKESLFRYPEASFVDFVDEESFIFFGYPDSCTP